MAIADRVRELSTTTGTGTITLGGAVAGYSSFATAFPGSSAVVYYCIADTTPGSWEVGQGTYTLATNTLTRTTVYSSSNSGSLVNFGAGNKDVFVTLPATIYNGVATQTGTETLTNKTLTTPAITGPVTLTGALTMAGSLAAENLNRQDNNSLAWSKYSTAGEYTIFNNALGAAAVVINGATNAITTGTWNAGVISAQYGGTGVNNSGKTITLGGSLTTSGAFSSTFTMTGTTTVTFPTSGTLATTAGTETFTNKTLIAPVISTISNTGTLTLPTSTDTLVGRATVDTLANKTLTTPVINGATVSVSASVTAGTNFQGQSPLTSDYNIITSAGNNPSGVTLPSATTGRIIVIANKGASPVAIFPAAGASIDFGSTNASITIVPGALVQLWASSTSQWYSTATNALGSGMLNLSANLTVNGSFSTSFNIIGSTSVTFPTTGTLATLTGTETFTNKTLTSPTLTSPVLNGTISGSGVSAAATGSTVVTRDSAGNVFGTGLWGDTVLVDSYLVLDLPNSNPETGAFNPIWSAVRGGTRVYADEDFATGSNSVSVYNNSGNSAVTITRAADASAPNSSGQSLAIAYDGVGPTSPGLGGFVQLIQSRRNAVFAQVVRAKLPAGYTLNTAANSMGTNAIDYWLTNNIGTGKWEWYIRVTHCGNTGTFSNGGHVYASGPNVAFTWYLASCTAYDITKPLALTLANTFTTAGNFPITLTSTASTSLTLPTSGTLATTTGNISGSAGSVTNAVTFNNAGAGATSGTTYNGSSAITVSYNTVGAPSTTGTNASGSWPITVTGNAAGLTSFDTRAVVDTPETVASPLTRFDLKQNTTNGLADGGTYNGVMTFRKYGTTTDWSGGGSSQLSFTDNGNMWIRYGSSTTWGSWRQFATLTDTQTLTNKTLTSPVINSATSSASITVTAGTNAQGQGALTSDFNIITTAANNPSGVTLPAPTPGRKLTVINRGANPVRVYPASGHAIDAGTTNASVLLVVGARLDFIGESSTNWSSSNALNLGSGTVNVGGNLVTTSGNALTLTTTGATNITLPTTGTIATLSGFEIFSNKAMLDMNAGQLAGFRNRFINGSMAVSQRGSVLLSLPNSITYGGCDRWITIVQSTAVSAVVIRAYINTPGVGQYAHQIGNINTSGSTAVSLSQRIESSNVYDFSGKPAVASCWVYQDTGSTVTFNVIFYKPTALDDWSAAPTILSVGSNVSVPNATWTFVQGGIFFGTSDVSNGLLVSFATSGLSAISSNKNFFFAGAQLEAGTFSTPLENRGLATETMLCRRYWRSSAPSTAYGSSTGSGYGSNVGAISGVASATTIMQVFLQHEAMRTTPSRSIWYFGTQNTVRTTLSGATVAVGAPASVGGSSSGVSFFTTTGAVLTAGTYYDFDIVEDAEL